MYLIIIKSLYDREYIEVNRFLTKTPEAWKLKYLNEKNYKLQIKKLPVHNLK